MNALRQREQEELEEAAQQLIAAAAAQQPFSNDLASVSTRKLLETVAGPTTSDDGASSARRPTQWRPWSTSEQSSGSNASVGTSSLLMVQKRLNAEYRHIIASIRDEHESRLAAERAKNDAKERELRVAHLEALKRIAAANSAAQDVVLPAVKAPSTIAVEVLERKLTEKKFQQQQVAASSDQATSAEGGAAAAPSPSLDPATRKVVTFWKAKYQHLAKQLEQLLSETVAAEAKCSQQVELRGASADTLEQMLMALREAESREKTRVEELRAQYFEECRRRRITPEEPYVDGMGGDVVYDPNTGRIVTKGEMARMQGSSSAAACGGGENGATAAQLYATLIREQKHKNSELNLTSQQVEARIRKLMVDYDSALEQYAGKAATYRGSSAQLLEEVIALLAEADGLDNTVQEEEMAELKAEAEYRTSARQMRESFEEERSRLSRNVEQARDDLRSLEVKLLCLGLGVRTDNIKPGMSNVSALEDEALVIASKIAVIENEIFVIRHERDALEKVGLTLDKQVRTLLKEKEAQVAALTAAAGGSLNHSLPPTMGFR